MSFEPFKLRLSRELMRMAAEEGARVALKDHVEKVFAIQNASRDATLTLVDVQIDMQPFASIGLNIGSTEIEWVE